MRAETHACALELATDPHPHGRRGDRPAGRAARAAGALRAGRRHGRRGGRHAPARPLRGRAGVDRRPLPRAAQLAARAGPPRADLRAARARRRARRRARPARLQRACACTCRCCSRCRPTRRSCAGATPAWPRPARRSSRRSRAPASRARSPTTRATSRRSTCSSRAHAIPEPTFIWWDVRLQPRLGTLEVRVMDAQTRLRDTAALAALVQCLVRLEALEGFAEPELIDAPEVLDENRFLAARDGDRRRAARPARRPPPDRLGAARGARRGVPAARRGARLRARARPGRGTGRATPARPASGPPRASRVGCRRSWGCSSASSRRSATRCVAARA